MPLWPDALRERHCAFVLPGDRRVLRVERGGGLGIFPPLPDAYQLRDPVRRPEDAAGLRPVFIGLVGDLGVPLRGEGSAALVGHARVPWNADRRVRGPPAVEGHLPFGLLGRDPGYAEQGDYVIQGHTRGLVDKGAAVGLVHLVVDQLHLPGDGADERADDAAWVEVGETGRPLAVGVLDLEPRALVGPGSLVEPDKPAVGETVILARLEDVGLPISQAGNERHGVGSLRQLVGSPRPFVGEPLACGLLHAVADAVLERVDDVLVRLGERSARVDHAPSRSKSKTRFNGLGRSMSRMSIVSRTASRPLGDALSWLTSATLGSSSIAARA